MKLLVIINNHNSFSILDLCFELQRRDAAVDFEAVCSPEFYAANAMLFDKRGITPYHLDPQGEPSTRLSIRVLSGVQALEDQVRFQDALSSTGLLCKTTTFLAKLMVSTSAYAIARECRIAGRLANKQKQAMALLERLRPDVVLSMSDRSHDYVESAVLWAARTKRIGIVLPYVAQFDIPASMGYRLGPNGKPLPELRPFHPFSLYKLWTYLLLRDKIYKGIFFQAPFILNAARRRGTLSNYPWWVGNGLSDIVCVDSWHTLEQYKQHRVAENKIAIVGHVQFDRVFQSCQQRHGLRQRLIEQYDMMPGKPLLVLSVPQYAEQGYMCWADHWRAIDGIVGNTSRAGHNLLLSVHPRSDINQYRYLAEQFNCRILFEPLAEIVGAADLFLASNSTTFTWSVLCGIPTIALKNPVRFLYGHLRSIRQVDDSTALPASINDVLCGPMPNFQHDWSILSRDIVFDGKFNERFYDLLQVARNINR